MSNLKFNTARAIIYDIQLPNEKRLEIVKRVEECEKLIQTYGGKVETKIIQRRHHVTTKSFIGHNKLVEITELASEKDINLIVLNRDLKPGQIYNIEMYLEKNKLQKKICIWDRVDLIIAIFSRHARSFEAKLQLELTKIEHFGPRIYGMGDELNQQAAGIGAKGLGETNTEIMKRHIAQRKKLLRKKIEKLRKVREANRKRRTKMGFKTVCIIGYTNAGKTELFRALTHKANTVAQNELFSTLDTSTANLFLPNAKQSEVVLLCDTIGFIRDLPSNLIDAFQSTLEEVTKADLLLNVVDVSDNDFLQKIKSVEEVLQTLKCADLPKFTLFNKIDKLKPENFISSRETAKMLEGYDYAFISAKNQENLSQIKKKIYDYLFKQTTIEKKDGHLLEKYQKSLMKTLKNTLEFDKLLAEQKEFIIYKHSSTCSLSTMAKKEVEVFIKENEGKFPFYEISVLEDCSVSNYVAEKSSTVHQSPQILIFKDGDCIENFSHKKVNAEEIGKKIAKINKQ